MPKTKPTEVLSKARYTLDAWLLAVLVFCLPLERIPSYEFHHLSLRPSLVIGTLLIMRWAYLVARRQIHLEFSWPVRIITVFLVWLVLLIPAALNTTRAAQVTTYTFFAVLVGLSVMHLVKHEYLPLLAKALFASASLVGLFGLYQYFGNYYGLSNGVTGILPRYSWQVFGFPRIQSTALEPLYYASYLLLPITLLIAIQASKQTSQRQYYPLLFLLTLNLFLTVSRGGNLAFILFMIALTPLLAAARLLSVRRLGLILLTIVLAYGMNVLILAKFNKPREFSKENGSGIKAYTKQITTINNGDDRAISRQLAINIIKKYPVIGIGPGNYGPYIQNNQRSESGWVIVNNEPLELWAETGIVGLGLILIFGLLVTIGLLRVLIAASDPATRTWALGLFGFLMAIAVQYQTFSTLYIVHIWLAFGLMLGLVRLSKQSPKA